MHAAVTAIGTDRPGIVAAVTKVLFDTGGNIEDSRMAILGGHFAMVLIVAFPDDIDLSIVERELNGPARDLGLVISTRPVAEVSPEHAEGIPYTVHVYGADRPGIVARVSAELAAQNVNISDLATHVIPGPVYVMILEVTIPAGADAGTIEARLKALTVELGVDVSFEPAEPETL